jgi:hypothetical protein
MLIRISKSIWINTSDVTCVSAEADHIDITLRGREKMKMIWNHDFCGNFTDPVAYAELIMQAIEYQKDITEFVGL